MIQKSNITGIILAGGLASRMNYQDKGLVIYQGQSLLNYAFTALKPLVSQILISANRNHLAYAAWQVPIIADLTTTFDGPLAGILATMQACKTEILLVIPCDSPHIQTQHLQQLVSALAETNSDVAVATDGQRWHPVILAMKRALKANLENYLRSGKRKISDWLIQQNFVEVDFSNELEIFLNINTLAELNCIAEPQSPHL